jgi:hypothetical protein
MEAAARENKRGNKRKRTSTRVVVQVRHHQQIEHPFADERA